MQATTSVLLFITTRDRRAALSATETTQRPLRHQWPLLYLTYNGAAETPARRGNNTTPPEAPVDPFLPNTVYRSKRSDYRLLLLSFVAAVC